MSGYVFIAFMLLVTGIYFTAYHMNMAYPIFGYTLSAVNFIFLIVTPILTMRALAEEQRQKTDQLLLTSPLSCDRRLWLENSSEWLPFSLFRYCYSACIR